MSSLIPTLFHQADRLFYSHKLFVGFSVEFAQRIFMFITLGVRIYFFDTLKHLIVDKIPWQCY